jgi:hypothetical protein
MSGTADAAPSGNHGHRAFRPGARWAFLAAAVVALVVAAGLVWALNANGSSRLHSAQARSFGSLPSWLPKAVRDRKVQNTAPQTEVATPARPILQEEQGYTVLAELPSGSVNITAVGPEFPNYVTRYAQRGLWPAGKQVPSTFDVTLAGVKGTIPLSAGAFSIFNQDHQLVGATLVAKGGGPVPSKVKAGQTVTVIVRTETLEGQGALQWAPLGKKDLVGWIYQLELD